MQAWIAIGSATTDRAMPSRICHGRLDSQFVTKLVSETLSASVDPYAEAYLSLVEAPIEEMIDYGFE